MLDLLPTWGLTRRLSRARRWLAGGGARRRPAFADTYDAVYARLDPAELRGDLLDDDFDDLLFRGDRRGRGLLGFYSEDGVRNAFEAYGFFDALRAKGFEPQLSTEVTEPDQHRLRIHDGPRGELLVELVMWVEPLTLPNGFQGRFLLINWLQMQDPRASFPPGRRPLPDQQHPGLGLFIEFSYLLWLTARRIGCDGLLNHPAHPHNGVLYGKTCHFVDPDIEGRFRALERDIGAHDLAELSDQVAAGRILDADGNPFVWRAATQVMPASAGAKRWFRSRAYRRRVADVKQRTHYHTTLSAIRDIA